MKFKIEKNVFETLPNLCIGYVVVKNVTNEENEKIKSYLKDSIKITEKELENVNVKELPDITCYRDAFRLLNINPNKYMCSIEALLSRISKQKGFPSINTLVDIGNAISIKYHLPIGAHDIDTLEDSLEVRYANNNDSFIAFGETEEEKADENELVYVSGNKIRTRRYIWRQSEIGKITESTSSVIFPIDGFNYNKEKIVEAQKEFKEVLEATFSTEVVTGLLDINNNEMSI